MPRRPVRFALLLIATACCVLNACARREPLTAAKAEEIIGVHDLHPEPVYAEVPQKVWWSDSSPADRYDQLALRTLHNLERAGLITVTESHQPGQVSWTGAITSKGFRILGTAPSARGPCFRALICAKVYDGLRHFSRHPTDPTIGHADLIWHYAQPTPMYPLFETKIDKPLNRPFASFVSIYYKDYGWQFDVTVKKTPE